MRFKSDNFQNFNLQLIIVLSSMKYNFFVIVYKYVWFLKYCMYFLQITTCYTHKKIFHGSKWLSRRILTFISLRFTSFETVKIYLFREKRHFIVFFIIKSFLQTIQLFYCWILFILIPVNCHFRFAAHLIILRTKLTIKKTELS